MLPQPKNLSFLIKPTSENCNIDCKYCFYHQRPEDPYATISKSRRMSKQHATTFLEKTFEYSNGGNIAFGFQGGEPLLAGFSFFEYFCKTIEKLASPNQSIALTVQTNGILLNEDFADLFKEYNFLIGVSLDGPPSLHDAYRVDYSGKPTHARVLPGIQLLQEKEVDFNILGVVNNITQHKAKEIYLYFTEELGIQHMQFNVCVEARDGKLIESSVTPDGYKIFLSDLFDVWIKKGYGKVSIRLFDSIVNKLINNRPGMCFLTKRCADTLLIEYNGDTYPCDFFVEKDYCMGNVIEDSFEDLMTHPNRIRLADHKETLNETCQACEYKNLCHGGCPKYRTLRQYHDGQDHFYFCEAYMALFEKLLPATREFIQQMKQDISDKGMNQPQVPR